MKMKKLKCVLFIVLMAFVLGCKKEKEETQNEKGDIAIHEKERLYKGMFSYVAKTDEVAFYECNHEVVLSLEILKDYDFKSLFDAYNKTKTNAVLDFAYVEFDGYITNKVVASEMDDMKTIRITKFLKIDKNKSCN